MAKVQIKASTRRTKTGKVVTIRAHDQNRDTVGDQLKTEGRTPTASQPGNFPNGRSTPTSPTVAKFEEERQDAEIRAAQIRARMAQQQLQQAQQQQQAQMPKTPAEQVAIYSVADQFDALMQAIQSGVDLPDDDEGYDKMADILLPILSKSQVPGNKKKKSGGQGA